MKCCEYNVKRKVVQYYDVVGFNNGVLLTDVYSNIDFIVDD